MAPLDPAFDENIQILYATCANLVTYPDKPAPAGSHIVPEVAEAVPTPTAGGTTYTFRIRTGFRFSPPSNAPVTAATFKSTIERFVNPRLKAPFASGFSDIVGYPQYVKDPARGLSGVVVRGNTLTIRLTHPDGGLLANLAVSTACAVPPGTPAVPLDHVPSAGPYYIALVHTAPATDPAPKPELPRRPPAPFRPVRVHDRRRSLRAVTEIEAGKADYASDGIPPTAAAKLAAEYGPDSKAAKARHQQYFANAANSARLLAMNASRPLFASARLRRAVNYAIDRKALVAQERKSPFSLFGGGGLPLGDYIPPSTAGARDFHLYPLRPDLKKAKRLAGHLHATAILYGATQPPWPQEAAIIARDLRPLGITVETKEFPVQELFHLLGRRGAPWDLAVEGWALGSTDPADWLNLFDGSTIVANANSNVSYFDDPAFDRKLHAIERLSGAKRYLAFSRLAYKFERDEAPAAAIATGTSQDFFSARIGCQLYQPVYGIDLGALCLRRPKA